MRVEHRPGASPRERAELTMAGLLPAVLALLPAMAAQAGRLCWLGPVLALSAGLWLCRLWRQLGQEDLPRGLEAAFGAGLGKAAQLLYLLWGLSCWQSAPGGLPTGCWPV